MRFIRPNAVCANSISKYAPNFTDRKIKPRWYCVLDDGDVANFES